jgi:hypothetical protein
MELTIEIATVTEMNLNRRTQIIILSSLMGMAVIAGIAGVVEARSKVYFPIEMETLVITKRMHHQHSTV